MTNTEVKLLIQKLKSRQELSYAEQLRACRDLLKANRTIIELKQSGVRLSASDE